MKWFNFETEKLGQRAKISVVAETLEQARRFVNALDDVDKTQTVFINSQPAGDAANQYEYRIR